MSQVRKCYAADCENNYMGAYCECCEITVDADSSCGNYLPKEKEKDGQEEGQNENKQTMA